MTATRPMGSVFLGDNQRFRTLASPLASPPSSPPAGAGFPGISESIPPLSSPPRETLSSKPPPMAQPVIDPALSLELRLRWLEAIVLGVQAKERKPKGKSYDLKRGETLIRTAEDVQKRLDRIVESNDGFKRFIEHYDQHAHFLTPAFAISGSLQSQAPSYESMSPDELDALLMEMEPDIRAADRDMREIEVLEKKGVTAAGRLGNYEKLAPRLDAAMKAHTEDVKLAASLEKRIATLMEKHATHVDALSELFVSWDDTLIAAENKVAKMERDREERKRLGYE